MVNMTNCTLMVNMTNCTLNIRGHNRRSCRLLEVVVDFPVTADAMTLSSRMATTPGLLAFIISTGHTCQCMKKKKKHRQHNLRDYLRNVCKLP